MRRIIVFLLVCLFLLSACARTKPTYEELEEKIIQYEDEILSLNAKLDDINYDILHMDDSIATLYLYFEEQSISFDEAYAAYDDLHTKLHKYY